MSMTLFGCINSKTILYSYLDLNYFDNISRSAALGISVLSTLTIWEKISSIFEIYFFFVMVTDCRTEFDLYEFSRTTQKVNARHKILMGVDKMTVRKRE